MTVVATIKSDGTAMGVAVPVKSIDVTHEVDRVPDAKIVIYDGDMASQTFLMLESAFFEPGKEIEILLRDDETPDLTVFKGLPARTSLRLAQGAPELVVELRGLAAKLTRVRRSAVFTDSKDSDVFGKMIGDAGLAKGEIDDFGMTHPELVQYRASDWDFMLTRAQAFGRCVVASSQTGKLSITAPNLGASPTLEIDIGFSGVLDYDLEFDSLGQPSGLTASSWDPTGQERVEAKKPTEAKLSQGDLQPPKTGATFFKDPDDTLATAPIDEAELPKWAEGSLNRERLRFLRGSLVIRGQADLEPLQMAELRGASTRFSGKALISGVRQRVDAEGWRTEVTLGLTRKPFVQGQSVQEPPAAGLVPPATDLQYGVVDVFEEDPDGEFRVRVKLPSLGKDAPAVWARLATPFAGTDHGLVFRPEAEDEVVVGFAGSDPRYPVILGTLFSSAKAPPAPFDAPSEENLEKGIVGVSGAMISFTDAEKPAVAIEMPSGAKVLLDDDGKALTLADEHGNEIVLDADGILLKSASNLTMEASGDVVVTGSSIEMK